MARSRRSRRAGLVLLLSIMGHGALLVWLIKSIPRPPAAPAALPFQISLVPDLERPEATAPEQPAAAATPSASKAASPTASRSTRGEEPPAHLTEPPLASTQPPPAAPSGPAPGAKPTISAGAGPDGDAQAAVRRALRTTLGCAHPDFSGLTSAERDDCSKQLGRQAAIGAQENLERVPEEKRVYYAKVQKAYQDIRDVARYGTGPLPGHGPALGCRLPFGIPKGWKPTRPPHSLKLGPLPCFITPPQGILTPEVDLPTP